MKQYNSAAPVRQQGMNEVNIAILSVAISIIVIFVFCTYLIIQAKTSSDITWRAILLIILSLLPGLVLLSNTKQSKIPVFALNCSFYGIAIGYSAFRPINDERFIVPEISTIAAIDLTIFGLLSQIAVYYTSNYLLPNIRSILFFRNISSRQYLFLAWLFIAIRFISILLPELGQIPSFGQFVGYATMIGVSMLYSMHLNQSISSSQSIVLFFVVIPIEFLYRSASGSIANLMIFALFLVIVKWNVTRKISWFFMFILAFGYIFLAPLKGEFRKLTWGADNNELTTIDRIAIYTDLVDKYWIQQTEFLANDEVSSSIDRFNQISIFGLVVNQTPAVVPYWEGETLSSAIYIFIPRIVWPDKPMQTSGNTFGQRYNILGANDASTSINLPWIVELYANFGYPGVVFGMGIFGFIFALIEKVTINSKKQYRELAIVVALTISLVYPESNITIQWGGNLLAAITFFVISRFISTTKII